MRDLDRIREVREFRVTGPQLTSFLVSAVVLTAAVFAVGYQLGRLQAPVDVALLEPLGADERDAGSLLAEMLAEDEAPALASTAPSLTTSDSTRSRPPAEPELVEEPELPGEPEPVDAVDAEPIDAEPIPLPGPADEVAAIGVDEPSTPRPALVVEVVERSFPADEPEPAAEPVVEPTPAPAVEAAPDLPTTTPDQPAVASLPGPPSGRGFTVQVGAFESLVEAADTLRSLQAQGHGDAFHVSAEVNGTTWHRVRVGLFPNRADADAAAQRLANATPHGTFVTSQP